MTVEQIQSAAQTYLLPDTLQMVIVGDPAIVRGPLEALGFGPVTLYDTQGKPIA
jgi:hypothetical protein